MPRKKLKVSKEELLAARSAIWPANGLCPLCGRPMNKGSTSLNEHHLIPRMYGGVEKHVMHRVCHSKIHSVFTEAELAAVYHTFEKLLSHPDIRSFVKWVRKQDPEFNTKHRAPHHA